MGFNFYLFFDKMGFNCLLSTFESKKWVLVRDENIRHIGPYIGDISDIGGY